MTPKEARAKSQLIAEQARAKLNEITPEIDAARAAEIEREFDTMMAEHDALSARADRGDRIDEAERRLREQPDPRRPHAPEDRSGATDDETNGIGYRAAFHAMLAAKGDIHAMAPEARAALARGVAQGAEFRAQVGSSDAAGGYTIPVELQNTLIVAMAAWGPMYEPGFTTEIVTTGGGSMPMPTVDDTGSVAEPGTEGAALIDDGGKDVAFGQKALEAYDYNTEFVKWSWQLAADSIFSMEALLTDLLAERLARIANAKLTTGSGSGEPHGILTAAPLGHTAASATAITFDELMDLEHSVNPAYRQSPRCAFMFNDLTFKQLRKLKNANGDYIWTAGDVVRGVAPTLLDRPYRINQVMPSIAASAKPVLFGDFSKYYVRKVGAPVLGVMRERFWPNLGIAGLIRFDGELADPRAIKHLALAAS
ncbi:MAG: HK97 family phage major capsid protein [Paracoccaceae bacterium]|jgi:HK97 family phage major capsid protein